MESEERRLEMIEHLSNVDEHLGEMFLGMYVCVSSSSLYVFLLCICISEPIMSHFEKIVLMKIQR